MRPARPASCLLAAICAATAATWAQEPPGFVQVLPDQVKWVPGKATPPGSEGAVIYGDPRKAEPFITRFKQPADYKVAPHRHPEERVYTVISGTFYIGFGEQFDPARLKAYPPGSVFVVPANASHFHWMRSGEAVVQISGTGPSAIEYVEPADDPRRR